MGNAVPGKPSDDTTPASEGPSGSSAQPQSSISTSQGFNPPLDPAVLRRSLIMSALASTIGAVFFTVIQGTVFNFFLEDLDLRERLPYFMGLWCIGGMGNLVGSWIQQHWPHRKALFFISIGGSRLLWIAIGLIPILNPEWAKSEVAFWWLSALTVLFYFVHSIGGPAWLSWMADLVPTHLQGKFWSLRQVGCSAFGIGARIGFGYLLEPYHKSHDMTGYAIIFGCATLFGLGDAVMFHWVEHRQPPLRPQKLNLFKEFGNRLKEKPFRTLCGVYLLWSVSNCIMGPTCFYFMRDHVGMGVEAISIAESISLLAFTMYSVLWGKFSDYHGHRGPLIFCLLVHALSPGFYFLAGRHDEHFVALAMAVGAIGFCGINLFMMPLLIHYTKSKEGGGREVGIAAFNVLLGISNFVAFTVADQWLYHGVGYLFNTPAQSTPVYIALIALGMLTRAWAAGLACSLPKTEDETAAGVVIVQLVTTNPLRAALGFFNYITGQEKWTTEAEVEEAATQLQRGDTENTENEEKSA
jgi:Na+/melibiose symporter-like transporter